MTRFSYQLREVKQTGEKHHSLDCCGMMLNVTTEKRAEGVCGRLCSARPALGQNQLNRSIPDRCLSNLSRKAFKDGDLTISAPIILEFS